MKIISIKTLAVDGFHVCLDDDRAALYPKEYIHDWQFRARPPKVSDALRADVAVNSMDALFRKDGRAHQEGAAIVRASHLLLSCLEGWNYKSETADLLPITLENINTLPRDVCLTAAYLIENPHMPSPEDLEKKS